MTLVTGPTALPDPQNVDVVRVETAEDMAGAVLERAETADVVIKSAAVGDYRPKQAAGHKIKKDGNELALEMEQTPDILKELGRRKKDQILVGFAAETGDLKENAEKKMAEKNLDMIVGNLIGPPESGFASDTNQVTLFFPDGTTEPLPLMEKDAVAHAILDRIAVLKNN